MVKTVALIGAGIISEYHLNALKELDELKAVSVSEINEVKGRDIAEKYQLHFYTDYKEMVHQENPDIVVIALPHFLHREVAIWCANQGCHLLLEKPMALNKEECDAIIEATKRNQVQLMVGHTQHYFAENRQVKRLFNENKLGQLVMINDVRHLFYYNEERPEWFFHKEKAGGGILMNLGAHSIDKIQWLTGSKIKRLKANVSYLGTKGNVEGSGVIYLETESGIPATISQSGYKGVNRNETEFIFTNGMIKLTSHNGVSVSENGEYRQVEIEDTTDPFILQFRDLLISIRENTEPECSGHYARSVISVIEAIYQSSETGEYLYVE